MFLFLSSVLCDTPPSTTTTSGLGVTTIVLLLIDVLFLFYMLLTQHENFKEKKTYIFLAHGSFFFLAFNLNSFTKGPMFVLVACVCVVVAYYFLCSIPLAVTIITVLNITILFPIINGIFIVPLIGEDAGLLVGGTVGLVLAIVLAVFFESFLLKVHNLFVVYIYSAMLVSLLGLTPLVSPGSSIKADPVGYFTAIVLFVVIGVLVFMR